MGRHACDDGATLGPQGPLSRDSVGGPPMDHTAQLNQHQDSWCSDLGADWDKGSSS